jgi:hypothetical protein
MLNPELRDVITKGVREVANGTRDAVLHPISYAKQLRERQGTGRTVMWGVGLGTLVLEIGSCRLAQSNPESVSYTFPALLAGGIAYTVLVGVFGHRRN